MTLEELKNNEQEISDKASQLYSKLYDVVMLLKGDVSPVAGGEYKELPGILGGLEYYQIKTDMVLSDVNDLLEQLRDTIVMKRATEAVLDIRGGGIG